MKPLSKWTAALAMTMLSACNAPLQTPTSNQALFQRQVNPARIDANTSVSKDWQQELTEAIRIGFFNVYDVNRNQTLEQAELQVKYNNEVYSVLPPQIILAIDANQDKALSQNEFLQSQHPELISAQDIQKESTYIWSKLDTNRDNQLNKMEVLSFYAQAKQVDQVKLENIFRTSDKNQDHHINQGEFPSLLKHFYFEHPMIPVRHQAFVLRIEHIPPAPPIR